MTYDQAAAKINAAKDATDLFGTDQAAAKKTFRKLSLLVHPDTAGEWRRVQAEAVFGVLSALWDEYSGEGSVDGHFTISTKKRAYAARKALYKGDIGYLYPVTWMEGVDERQGLMKMPQSPRDSDLMQAEAEALKALAAADKGNFAPELIDTFRHRDRSTKIERRVNVLERFDGFYTLTEVRQAYPDGLDARDVAWMWRRLLTAIGYAHEAGYVHGAVVPEHVMIHPAEHGLILVDWCYSVPLKTPIRAIVGNRHHLYPCEATGKMPVTQATDIHMATLTMGTLLRDDAPRQFWTFIRGCTLTTESMRPHDALDLLREFDELIERLYGPRKFRPFAMPAIMSA